MKLKLYVGEQIVGRLNNGEVVYDATLVAAGLDAAQLAALVKAAAPVGAIDVEVPE